MHEEKNEEVAPSPLSTMKVIFITGATGVIGSRLIPELLKDKDVFLKLLVRASSDRELQERLNYVLDFWTVDRNDINIMRRIEGLRGDITLENMGIDNDKYGNLVKYTTHIIHCATNIKLMLPLDEARKYTFEGTKIVIEFAKKCVEHGQFKRFNYLSTMEVAGTMKGLVPEKFISQKRRFLNSYEIAKAETENLLEKLNRQGFPLTIYRPSMVVGDSVTGRTIAFGFFYQLLKDTLLSPSSPICPFRPDWKLDIVPVDFVAKVICTLCDRPETNEKIYHIVAGPECAISLNELLKESRALLEKIIGKRLKPPKRVSPQIVYSILSLLGIFSYGGARKKIKFQQMLTKFLFLNQKFENSHLQAEIKQASIAIPKISDYLYVVCDYYLKNKKNG